MAVLARVGPLAVPRVICHSLSRAGFRDQGKKDGRLPVSWIEFMHQTLKSISYGDFFALKGEVCVGRSGRGRC